MRLKKIIAAVIILSVALLLFWYFMPSQRFEEDRIGYIYAHFHEPDEDLSLTGEEQKALKKLLSEATVVKRLNSDKGYQFTSDTLEIGFVYDFGNDSTKVYHVTVIPGGKCWVYNTERGGGLFKYEIKNTGDIMKWGEEHYKQVTESR